MRRARCCIFDSFVVDRLDERLWNGATPVPLGSKAFAVLARLLDEPHRLVTKEELLSAVWPGVAVSEAVLTTAVREIRAAIGDDARAPSFVETVYGRGYRFIETVEEDDGRAISAQRGGSTDSALVGRAAEWTRLRELFASVRHRRERCVALIAGEAGIGKTALVDAFAAAAAASGDVWVGRGQCIDQHGAGEAYMPLLEALLRLSREIGPAITEVLRDRAPYWMADLPLTDRKGPLPPAPVRPARMLRELAQAVEAITEARPLVLVLEDLQWSDRATLDWLAYMVRRRDPARLLVLGTYRPLGTLLQHSPLHELLPELRHQTQTMELVLDYLTRDAVRLYVQQRCGDLPDLDAITDVLHRRTGGQPLFLASIADELSERQNNTDVLQALRSAAIAVPSNVRQFIEHRLQRLSHEDRLVLDAASVAGELFPLTIVAGATSLSEEDVEVRCAALAARDHILVADDITTWPDGTISPRYRFRHALFQETVYLSISPAARARLHRAIGNHLEAAYGRTAASVAAELAVHFDEGRNPGKSLEYREWAASNAIQRSAYHDAQTHISRAQAVIQHLPANRDRLRHEAMCSLLLAQVLEARQGWGVEDVGRQYSRARDLCVALGDDARLLQATWGIAAASVVRADYHLTKSAATELLRLARRCKDVTFRMAAHAELGGTALLLGRARSARRHFDAAEALCARDDRRSSIEMFAMDMEVFTRCWATHLTWYIGRPDCAHRRAMDVLRQAEAVEHPFTVTIAHVYAAMLAQFRADRGEARGLADTAIAHAAEHDFPYYRACAEVVRGWAVTSADCDGGLPDMRAAIAALQSTAGSRLPFYRVLLAEGCAATGRVDEALAVLAQAFDQIEKTGERWWEPEAHRIRGELLRRSKGVSRETEACFRTALELSRARGARSLELRAAVGLATLLQGTAREKSARARLRRTYDAFSEGFTTVDLRNARAVLDN